MVQVLLVILIISVVPISLIKFKIVPVRYRLLVLFALALMIPVLAKLFEIPLLEYYTPSPKVYQTIVAYGAFVAVTVCSLFVARFLFKMKTVKRWWKDPHFQFFFIPISFAQQLLFQGFILSLLLAYFAPEIAVLVTALLFGYMHTIYPRPTMSFFIGTLGGLLFATMFLTHQDLLVSSVAHAILNFTAVNLGFFTLVDERQRPIPTSVLANVQTKKPDDLRKKSVRFL